MKRLMTGVCAVSMVVAVAGTAAAEAPSRADFRNAAKYCKALRTSSGSPAAFAEAVKAVTSARRVTVKNAYGKCVSSQARAEVRDDQQALSTAKSDCKAEQAQSDEEFGATHDGKTFAQFYGTNANGRNAYGRCVSQQARAEEAQADQENRNEVNAAKECKAEKAQSDEEFGLTHDGKTFTQFYGTNTNGRNAFGKCVSSKAKAKNQEQEAAQGS
jgi:hypothetical protein